MLLFQIAKNLVYLFDVVVHSDDDLRWFCHRLSVLCNFELVKLPAETTRVSRFFFCPVAYRLLFFLKGFHDSISSFSFSYIILLFRG